MAVVNLPPMLRTMFETLDTRVRKLELSSVLQAPSRTVDYPTSQLRDGMIWYRSDLHKFETRDNGVTRPMGEMKYYMNAYDTTNQAVASTASVYPIGCNTTISSNGITNSNGLFTIANAGVYSIFFSIQASNTDTSGDDIQIWMRQNGNDVAFSNSSWTVPSKHGSVNGDTIAYANLYFTAAAGDTIQMYFWAQNTTVSIITATGLTAPTRPSIPGVIITINQVAW